MTTSKLPGLSVQSDGSVLVRAVRHQVSASPEESGITMELSLSLLLNTRHVGVDYAYSVLQGREAITHLPPVKNLEIFIVDGDVLADLKQHSVEQLLTMASADARLLGKIKALAQVLSHD